MTNPKRQYNFDNIKSSKTRQIVRDAAKVAEELEAGGLRRMADVVDRLIRSRLASNATNVTLAADLRAALQTRGEN
ncbi:hypothetical protein KPG71_18930 [Roseovarius sp. PS-C2]|uniref:hypothetical protein n=1 Tax=Roseovarius sp. PS-C2 TaxID=2820814 RepID=UPI001C0AEB88|nr:hypothetical protein [Roseovarius sp. PS-C2]MBU3262101.1 hypothetical protein [Roseovarius sp. PS-C2]